MTTNRHQIPKRQRTVLAATAALGATVLVAGGTWHLAPRFDPPETTRAQVDDKGLTLQLGSIGVESQAGELASGHVLALTNAVGPSKRTGSPIWRSKAFDLDVGADRVTAGVTVTARPIRAEAPSAARPGAVFLQRLPTAETPASYLIPAIRVDKKVQAQAVESGRYQFISIPFTSAANTALSTSTTQCEQAVSNWSGLRLTAENRGHIQTCLRVRDGLLEAEVHNNGDFYIKRQPDPLHASVGHDLTMASWKSRKVTEHLAATPDTQDVEVIAPGDRRVYRFTTDGWKSQVLTFTPLTSQIPDSVGMDGWRKPLAAPPFSLDTTHIEQFLACLKTKIDAGVAPPDLRAKAHTPQQSAYAACLETTTGKLDHAQRSELAIQEHFLQSARTPESVAGAVARVYLGQPTSGALAAKANMRLVRDGTILINWAHLPGKAYTAKRVDARRYLGQDNPVTKVAAECQRPDGPTHYIRWSDLTIFAKDQKIVGWHLRENADGLPGIQPRSVQIAGLLEGFRGPRLALNKSVSQVNDSYPTLTLAPTDRQDQKTLGDSTVRLYVAGLGPNAQLTGASAGQTCPQHLS